MTGACIINKLATRRQVLSEFALIAKKTTSGSGGGFPEPAATFARILGAANLDVLSFGESK